MAKMSPVHLPSKLPTILLREIDSASGKRGVSGLIDLTPSLFPQTHSSSNADSPCWTGCHAGSTPGTKITRQHRGRNTSRLRPKCYRSCRALVATHTALDPLGREAVLSDAGPNRPRRLPLGSLQSTGWTRFGAIAAKSTLPFSKIKRWVACVTINDDARWASFYASATAGTRT